MWWCIGLVVLGIGFVMWSIFVVSSRSEEHDDWMRAMQDWSDENDS